MLLGYLRERSLVEGLHNEEELTTRLILTYKHLHTPES